jgi:hypothetical protein
MIPIFSRIFDFFTQNKKAMLFSIDRSHPSLHLWVKVALNRPTPSNKLKREEG